MKQLRNPTISFLLGIAIVGCVGFTFAGPVVSQGADGRFQVQPEASSASESFPAYEMGIGAGIQVTDQAVRERQSLRAKISGGDTLSLETIRRELVAEAYFMSIAPSKAKEQELSIAWDTLKAHLPEGSGIQYRDVQALLEHQILVSKPENEAVFSQRLLDREENQLEALRQEEERNAYTRGPSQPQAAQVDVDGVAVPPPIQMWGVRDIQLGLAPSECVVWDTIDRRCALNVGEFNLQALTFSVPTSIPMDTVRAQVVDKSLNIRYYAQKARASGWDQRPDVQQRISGVLNGFSELDRLRSATADLSDSALRRLYEAHRDRFAEHEDLVVRLTGTMDSVWTDSLRKIALAAQDSSRRRHRKSAAIPGNLVDPTRLPPALSRLADSLEIGATSPSAKTPYGTFFLSLIQAKKVPAKTFDEARDELYAMARSGEIGLGRTVRDEDAKKYYSQVRGRFVEPDTFELRTWLFPGRVPYPRFGKLGKAFDTISRKGRSLKSTALPDTTAKLLREQYGLTGNPLQIVSDPLGTWVIRIAKVRKVGRILPFEKVRDQIVKELAARPAGWSTVPKSDRDVVVATEALATSYWQNMTQTMPVPPRDSVKNALRTGRLRSTGLPKELPEDQAAMVEAQLYNESIWRAEQDAWKVRFLVSKALFQRS